MAEKVFLTHAQLDYVRKLRSYGYGWKKTCGIFVTRYSEFGKKHGWRGLSLAYGRSPWAKAPKKKPWWQIW